ncbi:MULTISPECIES: response regulator [Mucilaginibacter]|uniref:response regulator n=1 Tax=Mucilaginibacter TaxID=423349 RepID=UPI0016698F36|nr:response regulator transcription factor [Mucilaginibacter rubeus]GGA96398.1 DNA-binding response regulator [Mucilaginibacter rubeus]
MENIRVSIVEDMPEVRDGLRFIVGQATGLSCLATYSSGEEAYAGVLAAPPDIVIMDISLPGETGIDCIRRLKSRGFAGQFLMFTVYEDSDQIFEALNAGASGYLLKSAAPEKIVSAVQELYEGGSPMSAAIARRVVNSFRSSGEGDKLSSREMEVLNLLSKGFLYKEIAAQLFLSVGTIRQHIHHIYEKLHVQNRTEALNKVFGKM